MIAQLALAYTAGMDTLEELRKAAAEVHRLERAKTRLKILIQRAEAEGKRPSLIMDALRDRRTGRLAYTEERVRQIRRMPPIEETEES